VFLSLVFLGSKGARLRDRKDLNWRTVITLLIPGSLISQQPSSQIVANLELLFKKNFQRLNRQTKEYLKSLGLGSDDW
jgi:hypothetical protein